MRAVYTYDGEPFVPGDPPGTPSAAVLYQSKDHAEISVVTFAVPRPKESFDDSVVAQLHTATGQLVIFRVTYGGQPWPTEVARLAKALRPVTDADIDRLPLQWSGMTAR